MEKVYIDGIEQRATQPKRLRVLQEVLAGIEKDTILSLEIGSLHGASAKVLALFGPVICIDIWPDDSLRDFQQEMVETRVVPIRGKSSEVLPTLVRGSFDFAYVDGCHLYSSVLVDLQNVLPLVVQGGIICGDDLEKQLCSARDIEAAREAKNTDYIREEDYHPGVSLAVHEVFGWVNEVDGFWWVKNR
jgi:predicted O-methyltransferase YrrM